MADTVIDIFFMDDGRSPFKAGKHPRKKANGEFNPTPVETHYEAKHGLAPATYKSKQRLAEEAAARKKRRRSKQARRERKEES